MYALTTQAKEVWVKPRSRRIEGSATFTTVVSTTIIRSPTQRITRASQRVRVLRCSVMVSSLGVSQYRPLRRQEFIASVTSNQTPLLAEGLGFPESTRWHDGRIWLCN